MGRQQLLEGLEGVEQAGCGAGLNVDALGGDVQFIGFQSQTVVGAYAHQGIGVVTQADLQSCRLAEAGGKTLGLGAQTVGKGTVERNLLGQRERTLCRCHGFGNWRDVHDVLRVGHASCKTEGQRKQKQFVFHNAEENKK
ncbi:unknown [Prevotella sp. CAG:617]|nr:unknown [Prevotella sp. CAG:617]